MKFNTIDIMMLCFEHHDVSGRRMRTTLSIDDDVAVKLKRLAEGRSFKSVVNDALRAGLHAMESNQAESKPAFTMTPVRGNPRIKNLDKIASVIADVEGEDWR